MSAPDDIATGEDPHPLPDSRFCDTMTVHGQIAFYCIAPDPEDASRGLRVWRWLPWATELRGVSKWREQGVGRAYVVLATWAGKAVEEERGGCGRSVSALLTRCRFCGGEVPDFFNECASRRKDPTGSCCEKEHDAETVLRAAIDAIRARGGAR